MVRLSPLGADDLIAALLALRPPPPADEPARQALAERAGGSVRMAILLTQYGGLEIAEAIDELARGARARHRQAPIAWPMRSPAATSAIQFDIFNRHVLDLSGRRGERRRAEAAIAARAEPLFAGLGRRHRSCDRGNRDV